MLDYITLLGQDMHVLYLGRAPRTKETLLDFREKCQVTRHLRVFCGLTGSQRIPGFWGVTPPPPRKVIEEPGRSIERVQKLGTKPYDGSGDLEAAWLWLNKVNKVYGVMGCTDEQRVLFSNFLMEDRAKDWWDAVDRRYPDGITWGQFQQEFTDRFFPQSHKDSKIEEFFILEQKNMSVSDYEKRLSELVRLVPYIQVDEVLKCKMFLSGLQYRIRVHLCVVPQNRFRDLVEAALRV